MGKMLQLIFVVITALALIGSASTATAQEFYRGKTIRFVVGFAPRGGYDTYTRAIARHIGKHIPGNPSAVVENMPGGGSMVAANYLFNEAKPDGLTIGSFGGSIMLHQVLGNKTAKYDSAKFGWLGVPVVDHTVCALTKQSGVSKADQWFASKRPLKLGGTAPGASTEDSPKILKVATGLPLEVVTGYEGTSQIIKSAEAGEIDGGCWAWESVKVGWRKGLESGNARVVIQLMTKSHPELKDVPLALDYIKSDDGRQLMDLLAGVYGYGARPYAVSPGTPAERIAMLRKAFMNTLNDPAFLAEARKSSLDINPIGGETVARIFGSFQDIRPSLLGKMREVVLPKK